MDSPRTPKPYYSDDLVTIYHGDCRDILPELNDVERATGPEGFGFVRYSVVTDPPYGVGMRDFDDDFAVAVEGIDLAPGELAAVFTSPRRVPELVAGLPSWKFGRLLWMHKTADIAAPWRGWCMNSEAIGIFSRKAAHWPSPSDFRSDTYTVGPWERAGHPNGKPLSVIADLVRRLGTDTILDPFMGSGTTLVAAKNLGLPSIGIEIEERYCEIAARRCSQEVLGLSA